MAKQYHKNPRQITAKQYEALAIDLAELGDLGGIVHDLNSDEIIGGNQRSRVFDLNACDVVLTEVLPEPDAQGTVAHGFVLWKGSKYAYRQVRWTERQCEKANVVANKRGGSWDFDILADRFEQDDLLAWGFEPFELGLDDEPAEAGGDTEPQVDRAEELREKWGVKSGMLWLLDSGKGHPHRLVCGDCTDPATVARLGEFTAINTDPPYGIDVVGSDGRIGLAAKFGRFEGDMTPFDPAYILGLSQNIVMWGANHYADKLPSSPAWLVWDKRDGDRHNDFADCELAWCSGGGVVRIFSHLWMGYSRASERGEKRQHPTQKPVAVISWAIEQRTKPEDIIADFYSGSGTICIACENLGRRARMVEIDPKYCAVILERWAQHTGGTPVLLDVSGNS